MDWSSKTPNTPGWYWCHQRGETRMVKVWKYTTFADSRLFTNAAGGSLVADKEIYGAAKWQGPIDPPTRLLTPAMSGRRLPAVCSINQLERITEKRCLF